MFGSEFRVRKPVLLGLVFGVLLVVVAITATAQTVMVTAYASSSTLTSTVQSDVATIRGFVYDGLDGFDPTTSTPAELERVNGYLGTLVAKGEIVRAEIRDTTGRVLTASDAGAVGQLVPSSADFVAAVAGTPTIGIVDSASVQPELTGRTDPMPSTVIREYVPLRQGGVTRLIIALWRDAAPVLGQLDELRRDVVIVTVTGAVVAAFVLFVVFRSAQRRINRQTDALVTASRLDQLTQALNHGAIVGDLAGQIERARATGSRLGVALIDIDNFRLLNDNHGHRAGDDVLLLVARTVSEHLPRNAVMGRYGPDEFLVLAGADTLDDLGAMVERIRAVLEGASLQFETTERLPVTVSAGICRFPDDGPSVTDLLAIAAATLQDARASGGDAVRFAGAEREDEPGARTFDVLQGLVFAVDTKDRYTKRHSEDVARYAAFLGRRLGLDPSEIQTIHTAGLLHDVGKIGIPDAILRKPGRLTADELAVVKQHVALGDMIVRDLPEIDRIRDGIRHHHEQWNGRGYLTGLRGEDIPLIGRILAVGDAFSAMTTTRPYRKALLVREALIRLGDAAGTQLDEDLVEVFIRGMETAPDAPLPGLPDRPPLRALSGPAQVA